MTRSLALLEGDLGDDLGRDGRVGRPQGRGAEPGIAEVADGLVEGVAVLDLLGSGGVAEGLDMSIVEGLVLEELLMHPGVMHVGGLVGDLGHIVVHLHGRLGVELIGQRGVVVVDARAHEVASVRLGVGAVGSRAQPPPPPPKPQPP